MLRKIYSIFFLVRLVLIRDWGEKKKGKKIMSFYFVPDIVVFLLFH